MLNQMQLGRLLRNARNSQVVPLQMNCKITIPAAAATQIIVADNTVKAVGLFDSNDDNVDKVFLIVIGRAENTYDGVNALDCTTATHNQWQINLGGAAWADLTNDQADGQMADGDWHCSALGVIHPFTFQFDVTSQITNIDGNIGVRLENANADSASFDVWCDVYLRIDWKINVKPT